MGFAITSNGTHTQTDAYIHTYKQKKTYQKRQWQQQKWYKIFMYIDVAASGAAAKTMKLSIAIFSHNLFIYSFFSI